MSRYVDVLPDPGRALSQLFTYRVPEPLRDSVRAGVQVLVPFGKRTVVGVVAGLLEQAERAELKDVEAVLQDAPALPEEALPLARWMADYYLCELGEALRPFLPEGMTYRIGRRFHLTEEEIPASVRDHQDAGPVVRHLEAVGSEVSLPALRRVVRGPKLSRALRLLKSRNLVAERATLLPPRARARQVRVVEIAASPEEIKEYCEENAGRAPARVACLRAALGAGPLRPAELAARAEVSVSAVQGAVKQGLLEARWTPVRRMPWGLAIQDAAEPPSLTPEQNAAVEAIGEAVESIRPESFRLYGFRSGGGDLPGALWGPGGHSSQRAFAGGAVG
jgi:primosomal protein N' (replication factor Y)